MKEYKQLSLDERKKLYVMKKEGVAMTKLFVSLLLSFCLVLQPLQADKLEIVRDKLVILKTQLTALRAKLGQLKDKLISLKERVIALKEGAETTELVAAKKKAEEEVDAEIQESAVMIKTVLCEIKVEKTALLNQEDSKKMILFKGNDWKALSAERIKAVNDKLAEQKGNAGYSIVDNKSLNFWTTSPISKMVYFPWECTGSERNASALRRILEKKIADDNKEMKALTYVSLGTGYLYEDWAILNQLIGTGARVENVVIMDKDYKYLFNYHHNRCVFQGRPNEYGTHGAIAQFFRWFASVQPEVDFKVTIYKDIDDYIDETDDCNKQVEAYGCNINCVKLRPNIFVHCDVDSYAPSPKYFQDGRCAGFSYWLPCEGFVYDRGNVFAGILTVDSKYNAILYNNEKPLTTMIGNINNFEIGKDNLKGIITKK